MTFFAKSLKLQCLEIFVFLVHAEWIDFFNDFLLRKFLFWVDFGLSSAKLICFFFFRGILPK